MGKAFEFLHLDWLGKKSKLHIEDKRALIEPDHPDLSIVQQCDLLGLVRSSYDYQPVAPSEEDLMLMRLLDEQYTRTPSYGTRKMTAWLQRRQKMTTGIVGYDWPYGHTKQVAYATLGGGHIHELYMEGGGGWHVADLTALTNAPPVAFYGPPTDLYGAIAGYEWQAGGTKQVVYVGLNGHIQELYVGRAGGWRVADLTAIANPSRYAPLLPIRGYEWQTGGTKQVVYPVFPDRIQGNLGLQELYVEVGGGWQLGNLQADIFQ